MHTFFTSEGNIVVIENMSHFSANREPGKEITGGTVFFRGGGFLYLVEDDAKRFSDACRQFEIARDKTKVSFIED